MTSRSMCVEVSTNLRASSAPRVWKICSRISFSYDLLSSAPETMMPFFITMSESGSSPESFAFTSLLRTLMFSSLGKSMESMSLPV